MKYSDLLGPEKIVVDRLVRDEPLQVINSWLGLQGYNPLNDDGLKLLSDKYHDLVVEGKAKHGEDSLLFELRAVKDKLMTISSGELSPKDLAYVSNSINMLSKTISDYVDKNKVEDKNLCIEVPEFFRTLDFLVAEGFIVFNEGKYDELHKKLSATVPKE